MSKKAMYDLRNMLCDELDELARKGELGAGDLEIAHKLTDTIKNIDKIEMLEDDGYSRDEDYSRRYSRDGDWQSGIDLGTANTLIIHNGKVVVDEPSIVALDVHTGKLVAIGTQARQMHEKTNPNIKTIRPLKDGVIADFNATELMLRGMIKKVKTSGNLFAPSIRMVICIPSGSTNVEIRAVRDSAEHAGGREVYMIYEPMAAALGAGLDVEAPEGNMVIDIGGGTTEIACISLGGIVCSESINVAGDVFTNDIQSYVRQQHNIRIGERTAEAIKCSIGAAVSDLEEEPEDFVVTGPNMLTALPQTVSLSYSEIAYALEKSLTKIDAALMKVLESMPPELYADIVKNGIYLAGGGALIKGLDRRLGEKTGIPFHVAEDPLRGPAPMSPAPPSRR